MNNSDDPYAAERKIERDKQLAREYRDRPRYTTEVGKLAKAWMRGPEARRIKIFHKVNTVLEDIFEPRLRALLEANRIAKGVLTLVVADSVFLSEMKNHHHHRLLESLIHAGTGITEIKYRLKKQ